MGLCVQHIAPSKLFSISNPTYHFKHTLFEVAYHRYIIGHFVEWDGGMWWNGTVEWNGGTNHIEIWGDG